MFHLHIVGALEDLTTKGYGGDESTHILMGMWFRNCRPRVQVSIVLALRGKGEVV